MAVYSQRIQEYLKAMDDSITASYDEMWRKAAEKIRSHYAARGMGGSGDVVKAMGDQQGLFAAAAARAKQAAVATAAQMQWQEDQAYLARQNQNSQYADVNGIMNRMNTAQAMGGGAGGGGGMQDADRRWQAYLQANAGYGYTSAGYPTYQNPGANATGLTGGSYIPFTESEPLGAYDWTQDFNNNSTEWANPQQQQSGGGMPYNYNIPGYAALAPSWSEPTSQVPSYVNPGMAGDYGYGR